MLSTARGRVAILTTLAILAVLLTAGAASGLTNGKIAFSIDNEVWIMNADGSNAANFTDGQAGSGFLGGDEAAWSPDGTKILYGTQDTVYSEAIYWRSADGGVAHKIVDNRTVFNSLSLNRNGAWSGDGTKIAFASSLLPNGQYDIYSINVDETGLDNLTENAAHDLNPAWSHDGTKIAFASNRTDGFFDIWVMDADGSNPTQLTSAIGNDQWPRWSPDDSQIVFWSTRDSDDEIYRMNADGSNQVRLTSSSGADGYPDWSPDGTKIIFMSQRGGQDIRHLFVMNPDGSDQTQIGDMAGSAKPDWQPAPGEPPPPPPVPGTIRIFLDANPDGAQDFAFTGSGAIGSFSLDDDADLTLPSTRSFTGLTAGSYSLQQIVPNGWTVVGLTCTDPDGGSSTDLGTAAATIDLDAGETVDCQYLDVPAPATRIRIVVDAVPDDTQDFSFSGSGSIGTFDLDDDSDAMLPASRLIPLSPGSYSVQQSIPGGWDLTNLACVDPDSGSATNLAAGTATIDLDQFETVTCTYTDTKAPQLGTITITNDAVPDDRQDFAFSGSGTIGGFSLDDDADPALPASRSFGGLAAGSYTVQETVLGGWSLTGLTCTDPDSGSSTNLASATATIDLDAGETVACTYTNTTGEGTIRIELDAVPDDEQDFFYGIAGGVGFNSQTTLDDDADPTLASSKTYSAMNAGSYTVAQQAQGGWDLTALTCVDPDGGSSTNLSTRAAFIDLDPGETISCTFTNRKRIGNLEIHLDSVPDDEQDFFYGIAGGVGFNSQTTLDDDADPTRASSKTYSAITAGSYTVVQQAQGGWDLTALACVDPDGGSSINLSTRAAFIDLDPGETISCTFTNRKRIGNLEIRLDSVPDDEQDFFYGIAGGVGFNSQTTLDDDADPTLASSKTYSAMNAGSYTVAQQAQGGWDLTALTCVDPDGGSSTNLSTRAAFIDLDPGETISCTFTNTKDTVPPTLTLPADFSVNATSSAGATVVYSSSASDNRDPSPTLSCVPASGSVFPIGTTTATCTATDAAGNSATAGFSVQVRGAAGQITLLRERTLTYLDRPRLGPVLAAPLDAAAVALTRGNRRVACRALDLYVAEVRAAPAAAFTPSERATLRADATRIRTVLGC